MNDKPLESDWKIFSKHVPQWRERYLAEINKNICTVLSDEKKTPTEQFWEAKELMKDEAKILVTCLDGHSRSKMILSLQLMFRYNLIGETDLAMFSKELEEKVLRIKAFKN